MKHLSFILFFSFFTFFNATSQTLDSNFGTGGSVIHDYGSDSDRPRAAMILKEDKILIAGTTKPFFDTDNALMQLNPDGSLDASFGTNGKVSTDVFGGNDGIRHLLLQEDNKIIGVGTAQAFSGQYDFSIYRYLPNGALDPDFGTDGIVVTSINPGNDEGFAAAFQPDNKIVVAGRTVGPTGNWDFGLVRYLPNGEIDADFGIEGTITTDVNNENNELFALILDSNGNLLTAGYSGLDRNILIIRYLSDGSIDGTFGNGGVVLMDLNGLDETIYHMVIDNDGKILVSGNALSSVGQERFFLARYLNDGSLDETFGSSGVVFSNFGYNIEHADSFEFLPDGKILVGGWIKLGGSNVATLFRYTSTGVVDSTFGQNGLKTYINNLGIFELLVQDDGKIVGVGEHFNNFQYDFGAFRIGNDDVSTFQKEDEFTRVSISPNPATNAINLQVEMKSEKMMSVDLFDSQGKKVNSYFSGNRWAAGKHTKTLPLSADLPTGIYFLVLHTDGQVGRYKIVKK